MTFATSARLSIEQSAPWRVVGGASLLLGIVVGADVVSGSQLSFSYFYVLPLALVTWRFGRSAAFAGSFSAALIWLAVDLLTAPGRAIAIPVWNSVVRACFFLTITGLMVTLQAALTREQEMASLDALTTLPNRRAFALVAERELARSERSGEPITFVVVDLDDLKRINDGAGHAAGDAAIKAVADILMTSIRRSDMAARLGGDEFALMLLGTETSAVLERILGRVAGVTIAGNVLDCSIGSVVVTGGALTDALAAADDAMYAAKRAGKGWIVGAPHDVSVDPSDRQSSLA